ncbi:hypothetical protein FRC03_011179, partial [Tulasnella sp. 419]
MAMKSALDFPEILSAIFEFCPSSDLPAVGRTCRTWSEQALRILWKNLDSIVPLITILSPLERQNNPPRWYYSTNCFTLDRYERLEHYSKFVRTLFHDDFVLFNGQSGMLQPNVYLGIAAAFIGRQPFLPNLQHLECIIRHEKSAVGIGVLASAQVTNLELDMRCKKGAAMVFESLRRRLSSLRDISITVSPDISVEDVEVPLSGFLADSPSLRKVALPQFFLSERVSSALRASRKLESLLQTEEGDQQYPMNQYGCNLDFDSEGFDYLNQLEFNMGLTKATNLLLSPHPPDSLTTLNIATSTKTEEVDLHNFLHALGSRNSRLRILQLNLHTDKTSPDPEPIAFAVLSPLLKLDLHVFIIAHDQPLSYTDMNIVDMARAWPNMISLYLNEEIDVPNSSAYPPGLDITHLRLFASFPKLEYLGVYVQVHAQFLALASRPYFRLEALEELSLGTSVLPDATLSEEIAIFMATLMPDLDVEVFTTYSPWLPPRQGARPNITWDEVFKLWPKFFRAQEMLRPNLKVKRKEPETQSKLIALLLADKDSLQEENPVLEDNAELVASLGSREQELQAEIDKLNTLLNRRKEYEPNQE